MGGGTSCRLRRSWCRGWPMMTHAPHSWLLWPMRKPLIVHSKGYELSCSSKQQNLCNYIKDFQTTLGWNKLIEWSWCVLLDRHSVQQREWGFNHYYYNLATMSHQSHEHSPYPAEKLERLEWMLLRVICRAAEVGTATLSLFRTFCPSRPRIRRYVIHTHPSVRHSPEGYNSFLSKALHKMSRQRYHR